MNLLAHITPEPAIAMAGFIDPRTMTHAEIETEMLIIRRELLERHIEAAVPYVKDEWIAALDDLDGDPDLEASCDDDADSDLEEENEHGGDDGKADNDAEPYLSTTEGADQERRIRIDPFFTRYTGCEEGELDGFADIRGAHFEGEGRSIANGLVRQAQCHSPAYWMRRAALRARP